MASAAQKIKQNLATLEASHVAKLTNKNWKSYTHANRTKTKKNIASMKKQIGLYESIPFERNLLGSSVNDSSFKYTTDSDRKRSVIAMYPFFPDLVRIPFMIDWASYSYKGPSTLLDVEYDDDSNSVSNRFYTTTVDVSYSKSPLKKDCFLFFGGCAYEILNHVIKHDRLLVETTQVAVGGGAASGGAGNYAATLGIGSAGEVNMNYVTEFEIPFLHDLVDPTGDVDLIVRRPYVNVTHTPNDGPYDYDYTDETRTTLNQWVLHWVNWLFDNVVTIFKSSITRKGILSQTEPFDLMDNHEIEGGAVLRSERIDNAFVVLFQQETMVKVQIVMKLKDVSESDHYFEMVIPLLRNNFNSNSTDMPNNLNKSDYGGNFELICMNLPNVRIQSLYSLINGNQDSIENRFQFAISPLRHKFYNHVQRLKYLNQIFPHFVVGSEEFGLSRTDPRRYPLSRKRAYEIARKPYLIDITNTTVLSSFQKLFQSLKTFDDPHGVRGLLGNNFASVNPICLFDYKWAGEPCTLEQVEMELFGNMIPIFSKMLQSTEKGTYKNLNRFTKRKASKTDEKPVYAPIVQTVRNRRTRRFRSTRRF